MRFEANLATAQASAREARDLIDQELGDRLPAVALYDLLTIVSELVANAARFGEGGEIFVYVELGSDGEVSGAVENIGSAPVEPSPLNGNGSHGLGLHIIDALAERWRVERDGTTRVSFMLEMT
jgi:serine/threonine-protein kinase RsbW